MSNRKQRLGKRGENAVADFLKRKGYRVVNRRWRTNRGEIDLVCLDDGEVVFVEVKTRRSKRFGPPESSITKEKFTNMIACAEAYLRQPHSGRSRWRIDVVSVFWQGGRPVEITHFKAVDTPYQH